MKSLLITLCPFMLLCTSAFAGLVQPVESSSQILVPAAASAPGANGTFWRSDIEISNFAGHQQIVSVRWLPEVGTGTAVTKLITLGAYGSGSSYLRSTDFVAEYIGQAGLGAILLSGIDSDGASDPTARLFVSSRVWTPQPGTSGTTSQTLPTLPVSEIDMHGPLGFPLFGVPNNSGGYRTNIGFVNLDPANAQTFSISWVFFGDKFGSIQVTVPPMSMVQFAFAPLSFGVDNVTPVESRSSKWIAYGSTIDNETGDAWSELAVQIEPPK